ncbi:MAG: PEP-CTERM sorting domain-containing protein, partial [Planctomycetales bacterium]|nr:PEP-CTERM sorting domain-containing protein [Planctomycetales bacterium]
VLTLLAAMHAGSVHAADILAPGDFIIAIDRDVSDPTVSGSSYPAAERPVDALDQDETTKYLNFGELNSGFIVTPQYGPSIVQSFTLTTANDADARDPSSWALYGTNDDILSVDNSHGTAETWTLIDNGDIDLPLDRFTSSDVIEVNNSTIYSSYRLIFPTVRDTAAANSMQIADVYFYESNDGSGFSILDVEDPIVAVCVGCSVVESSSPAAETVDLAIDGDTATKYLNFGEENSGFIVTPEFGSSIVTGLQVTTANDAEPRDPAAFELYGTNDPILSTNHSTGDLESWTLIEAGTLELPPDRFLEGDVVTFANTSAYTSYRLVFTEVKDVDAANSMQISEVQFFGEAGAAGTPGDYNGNGIIDAGDLDVLAQYVRDNDARGDLNGDGTTDEIDRSQWVETIQKSYFGDSNFDGEFSSSDFVAVFTAGKYETGAAAGYAEGDWNGDGLFSSSDFVTAFSAGGYEQGPRAAVSAVPEPATISMLLLGLLGLSGLRRRS